MLKDVDPRPAAPVAPGFRLPPLRAGSFTFVMATAIVSISVRNTGAIVLSDTLFWLALASFLALSADYLVRLARQREANAGEARGRTGFLSLTVTAAAAILASRLSALDVQGVALALTLVAAISWLALTYAVIVGQLLRAETTFGLEMVDGTWFLWVVGTQSVAVAAGSYAAAFHSPPFATVAAAAWSIGLLQFLLIASVAFARLLLTPLAPDSEAAPYWVFMGSASSTALAGATLLKLDDGQTLVETETIASLSAILWAFSTWLIPLIVTLALWQRLRPGGLSGYRPMMWSMVFPIGMYGEASRQFGEIRHLSWLEQMGEYEAWLALALWAFVFVSMIVHYLPSMMGFARAKLR